MGFGIFGLGVWDSGFGRWDSEFGSWDLDFLDIFVIFETHAIDFLDVTFVNDDEQQVLLAKLYWPAMMSALTNAGKVPACT